MTTTEAADIAALKTEVRYLTRDLEALTKELAGCREDIQRLTELVANARGAKWMLLAIVGSAATVGAVVAKVAPYLHLMPKA